MSKNKFSIFLMLSLLLLLGCDGNQGTDSEGGNNSYDCKDATPRKGDWVIVHNLSDPDVLNPITMQSRHSLQATGLMFYSLMDVHPHTQEIIPLMVKDRPEISDDRQSFTFEFLDEAKWKDGSPVTGYDFVFSVKVIKCPKVNSQAQRPYYEFIKDIIVDETNPKRFTVLTNGSNFRSEMNIGFTAVLPEYLYDPNKTLRQFSFTELDNNADALGGDPKVIEFASEFNSDKYARDPAFIEGAGPYELEEWISGQKVVLKRKENWWADSKGTYPYENYPEKVIFKTINDFNTARVALRGGEIDVMMGVPAKDFNEMKANKSLESELAFHTPDAMAYGYIAMNCNPGFGRKPYFNDKRVRRAMAHLIDTDEIIEKVYYGYGHSVTGPIVPSRTNEYDPSLKPIQKDHDKAIALLEEAGWTDSDNDGIRDKMINNVKVSFSVEIMYNQGNDERKNVALILQEEAKKVGIEVKPVESDWSVFLEDMTTKNFDMYVSAVGFPPLPMDYKQSWHSESINNGTNYIGFANQRADSLIDAIRSELDDTKRPQLYKELHNILYDEQPCIWTYCPQMRIIVHKRFKNAETSPVRPNVFVNSFYSCEKSQKYPK